MSEVLQIDSVTKRFPGVIALDGVTLRLDGGSVHALVGENGAGKSTLLKILSGVYKPDAGEILLDGKPVHFKRPSDAFQAGLSVIYQELHLVSEMTVAENIFLGHMPTRAGLLDSRAMEQAAAAQLQALDEPIIPSTKVGSLPIAQRQMVEIAKALARDARVIAFDEPTSSLSKQEVRKLFAVIRQLKAQGKAILYVSHRMEEIFEICDKATVLRDGRLVETFDSLASIDHDTIVTRMVGRDIKDIYRYESHSRGTPMLDVAGLWGPGLTSPISLSVAAGEIVGLFGLIGAGRTELLKLIYGAVKPRAGSVRVAGRAAQISNPQQAIQQGIVFCPEDRKREGIVAIRSVQENINISARADHAIAGLLINSRWEQSNASHQVEQLRVKTPSLHQLVASLSGGNQQKVILGRLLSGEVKVVLLDEPTRGIDVGAKSEIYSIIRRLAAAGAGILMVSSDLPEVLGVADRVIVMREGGIVGQLNRAEAMAELCLKLALPTSGKEAHA